MDIPDKKKGGKHILGSNEIDGDRGSRERDVDVCHYYPGIK